MNERGHNSGLLPVACFAILLAGAAQAAEVLLDLVPGGPEPAVLNASGVVYHQGRIFFEGEQPLTGRELFMSDGTLAGTVAVADLCSGRCSSQTRHITWVGEQLFFQACHFAEGCEVWAGDSVSGIPSEIQPLSILGGRNQQRLTRRVTAVTPWGDLAVIQTSSHEVWLSDGTVEGTFELPVARPENRPRFEHALAVVLGDRLVFLANGVWIFNGEEVEPVLEISGVSTEKAFVVGNWIFFATRRAIWRTDGTAARTVEIERVDFPELLFADDERVYFQVPDGNDFALWMSDGTARGTRTVPNLPVAAGGFSAAGAQRGGRTYVTRLDTRPLTPVTDLWSLRRVDRRASLVTQIQGELTLLGSQQGPIYLADSAAGRLYRSFGTAESTVEIDHSEGRIGEMLSVGQSVVYQVADVEGDLGLAVGSRWGVSRLDLSRSPLFGDPQDLLTDGAEIFFNSPTQAQGGLTNGQAEGTVFFGDRELRPFRAGDRVYYWDPTRERRGGLWILENDDSLTRLLGDDDLFVDGDSLIEYQGRVFFSGYFGDGDYQLWSTDGTAAGTTLVHGELPSFFGDATTPTPVTTVVFNDSLYVVVEDILWRSNGTDTGTELFVASIYFCPSCFFAGPITGLMVFGDRLAFFAASQWITSDGTLEGTTPVGPAFVLDNHTAVVDGFLFFAGNQELETGIELAKSDGEEIFMVQDIRAGQQSSSPREMTAWNGRVYFTADDGIHGRELWVSDGTSEGTRMVGDLQPGPRSSAVQELTVVDGRLYFAANDGMHGLEPWVLDSHDAEPRMVEDIEPGSGSSSPRDFLLFGGRVTFNAGSSETGFELWQE